jgi:hypothetical protein
MRLSSAARRRGADEQLSLELSWLSDTEFLAAMRLRGASDLARVRFRPNRTRLVSLSADRATLNVNAAFRSAPGEVLDAIAAFASATRSDAGYRRAVRRLRHWWERQTEDAEGPADPARRAECCGTPVQRRFLAATYARLNRSRFGGELPDNVPLRLSARMSRRFGHIHYGRSRTVRAVEEIALNVDLMLPGNGAERLDTLLHVMAHAADYLESGNRGHGASWRAWAKRVGARPDRIYERPVVRRRRRRTQVTRVPPLPPPLACLLERPRAAQPAGQSQPNAPAVSAA